MYFDIANSCTIIIIIIIGFLFTSYGYVNIVVTNGCYLKKMAIYIKLIAVEMADEWLFYIS